MDSRVMAEQAAAAALFEAASASLITSGVDHQIEVAQVSVTYRPKN